MIHYQHAQVQEDLAILLQQNLPWQFLKGKTVLVTGATGMLASYVGFMLLYLNSRLDLGVKPVFLARSKKKLEDVYGSELRHACCLIQDVCDPIKYNGLIDYVFHAAGASSPHYILNDPVGIINANVQGTQQVLDVARSSKVKKVVFASTREVYGRVEGKSFIAESDMGVLDPLNPRDCYPESKRLAEAMLMAYYTQYKIDFNSVRIAHSYGPGMQIEGDGRVMSDLVNDAVNSRDIFLKSSGDAERAFCYITDAVSGIYRVMLQGESARAYNLANEKEPIRIFDLAKLLQELVGSGKGVTIASDSSQAGYTNYARTAMDTTDIESIGWEAKVGLREGLQRTLRAFGVRL